MKLRHCLKTDVGQMRDHNEDYFAMTPEDGVYIVNDGMGGHASGEVASEMAANSMLEFFKRNQDDGDFTWPCRENPDLNHAENLIVAAIKLANRDVWEASNSVPQYRGMGTTCVVTYAWKGKIYMGWAGDSRGYRIRGRKIEQITADHSLLNDYLKTRELSQEEIDNFPHKNVIVRALGMGEHLDVDVISDEPKKGDIYLACSDGLTDMVKDDQMLEIVRKAKDIDDAVDKLIATANEAGGKDNITVMLLEALE